MNVFHREERIGPDEVAILQAFADTATIGILQERAISSGAGLAAQLQSALNSRITIEQAKGMVSEQLKIGVDEAFTRIRSHARATSQRITDVAAAILNHTVAAANLGDVPATDTTTAKRLPR